MSRQNAFPLRTLNSSCSRSQKHEKPPTSCIALRPLRAAHSLPALPMQHVTSHSCWQQSPGGAVGVHQGVGNQGDIGHQGHDAGVNCNQARAHSCPDICGGTSEETTPWSHSLGDRRETGSTLELDLESRSAATSRLTWLTHDRDDDHARVRCGHACNGHMHDSALSGLKSD